MGQSKWRRRAVSVLMTAGMMANSCVPMYAAASSGSTESPAAAKEIASIDFNETASLDEGALSGWKITKGSGTTELVDDLEAGKVLKMQRTAGGAETSLQKDNLGIKEDDYRYVTVETKMKLGTEDHANQFSIPYLFDSKNTAAYTIYTDGDWTEYKSHVNGKDSKNKLPAGTVNNQWQTVQMDIDLEEDTYRIAVDGEYLLAGAGARAKTEDLDIIKFYADSWNTGTLYLKSVKVTAQKERQQSAVFYVSNTGDDSADGTSEDKAWKTVERVNQEHFIPGDKILFQRGGIWENQTLQPQGSGDADNKITIGSYGEGEMPRLSINGKMKDGLYLCNQQYWEISELDISNTVEGFTQITNGEAPTANNAARDESQGKLLGEYRGIHIAGRDEASLKGFWLHDLKVHDVTGDVAWIGNTGLKDAGIVNNAGLDGSKRTGGVLIECLQPTGNQPTQFSDIVIEDSEFINNSFCGITVKQWNGPGSQYSSSPGWANRNGAKGAPDYEDSNWYPHSNITIQNNYINQGASAYACNGIYLTSSKDSLIQRNVLEHIGTCGIELYFTDNVAIQYNEVSDVVKKGGGADDNAIDPDWRVTNALIQYNYVHDAGEGFLLCGVQFNTGVIRYNLVQDCTRSYVHYSMGSGYFQIYNNVFYRSKDGNSTNNFDPWGGGKAAYFNNIFYDGKGEGFNYSGSSSFAFDNNAYYGTKGPAKDANQILLTEDPFEGTAPSLERMGSFATGVLLEANGLRVKKDSPLIGSGSVKDPNGYSIEEGLKDKGKMFNFTPLAAASDAYFDGCIPIERTDYPTFEKSGAEATFDTSKTQTKASGSAPTIGMFEIQPGKDEVLLRGKVTDGMNALAGAAVEVQSGGMTVSTTTSEAGTYFISEGLVPGKATVTVKADGREDTAITVELESGKVNVGDIRVKMLPMPDKYPYSIMEENFDGDSASENFSFNKGSEMKDGELIITKNMGNAEASVSEFAPEILGLKGVDFSFDWRCDNANKMGFEFRDSYGRLLFAVCAAPQKKELRTSTTGGAVDADKAASQAEPEWKSYSLDTSKTYTIRVHADFDKKLVSYQVAEKDSEVLVQQLNVPTDAVNLGKMIACSWWDSKPQYMDNFELTAPEESAELPLKGKTIYAFGDSIVAGHQYTKASFADFVATREGMELQKFAVNGATILDAGYMGGQILTQVMDAPEEAPDYVLFDGGTNDAEYIKNNEGVQYGSVTAEKNPDLFDTATFAGAFEKTVYEIKQKWPDAQILYTAVHKMGTRDNEVQEELHKLQLQICSKWEAAVANLYEDAALDTNDTNQKNNYTFDSLGSNGFPGVNGSGTHPNLAAIEEFYVPIVAEALRDPKIPEGGHNIDKSKLNDMIQAAQGKAEQTDTYTQESIAKLLEMIEAAKKVADNPDALQEDVDTQTTLLKDAVAALKEKVKADKLSLADMIGTAEGLSEEDFSASTWKVLTEKLEAAKAVMDNAEASQEEVDAAYSELVQAFGALESGINKIIALQMKAEAETVLVNGDQYQSQGITDVQDALALLNLALENPDITQTELDRLALALLDALMCLRDMVDGSRLQAVIETAESLLETREKFTAVTADALAEAVAAGKLVIENEERSLQEVEDACRAVSQAIAGLQYRGNREVLKPFLEKAAAILEMQEKYAADTLEGLEDAVQQAQAVYENIDALQKEINDAAKLLAEELAQVRLLGDLNHDNEVNTADTVILLKVNAELNELQEGDFGVADVNGDGSVDTKDAALIQKYAAELISDF